MGGSELLILTRRTRGRIVIGDGQVTIEVLKISRDSVQLGFTADKSVKIDREEVWVQRQKETK